MCLKYDNQFESRAVMQRFFALILAGGALVAQAQTAASAYSPAPNTIASLYRQFQAPPDDARPMMRWWCFGPAVTKPELQKELKTMRRLASAEWKFSRSIR